MSVQHDTFKEDTGNNDNIWEDKVQASNDHSLGFPEVINDSLAYVQYGMNVIARWESPTIAWSIAGYTSAWPTTHLTARLEPLEPEIKDMDSMTELIIDGPDQTKWKPPIVLLSRKYDTVRFCVKYCKLNTLLVPHTWSTLLRDACISSLR